MTEEAKKDLAAKMSSKYMAAGLAKGIGKGAAFEGLTETAQELIGFVGANYNDLDNADKNELKSTLLNAAVAGFTLGGGFASVSVGGDILTTRDIAKGSQRVTSPGSRDLAYQTRRKAAGRPVQDIGTEIENAVTETLAYEEQTLEDLAKNERAHRRQRGITGSAIDYVKKGGLLVGFQGWAPNLLNPFFNRGDTMVTIGALMGANNAIPGMNNEVYQQAKEGEYMSFIPQENESATIFGVRNSDQVSQIMYDPQVQAYIDKLIRLSQRDDLGSIKAAASHAAPLEGQYKDKQQAIVDMADKLDQLDKAKKKKRGHWMNDRKIDKAKLEKNFGTFVDLLVARGFTPEKATKVAEDIRDLDFTNDITEAEVDEANPFGLPQETTEEAEVVTSLQNDPDFADFYDQNLYFNVESDNARQAAIDTGNRYFGKNGTRMANLLRLAKDRGEITQPEMEYLAAELQDFLDAKGGRYSRIQNDFARKSLQWGTFFATLNQLPLATLASFVELGLSSRLVTSEQTFGLIAPAAKNAAAEMNEWISDASRGYVPHQQSAATARSQLQRTGFLQTSQSAKQRAGANDISARTAPLTNKFFKAIGLQGYTNFTRSIRLAIAGDAVNDWVATIAANEGKPDTLDVQDARENLVKLGVDVDFLVDTYLNRGTPDDTYLEQQLTQAEIAFTDAAVANPRVGNRPKFYQNKYIAPFTTFQGFISTFTANILPEIYKGLVKNRLTHQIESARTLALLIALGFLVQNLRDLVKYGEEPDWLDDEQKFQRAIYSSGILGTGERLVDMAYPLYPQRSSGNVVFDALNTARGEAPLIGYLSKVGRAGGALLQGDLPQAAKWGVRSAPGIGISNYLANEAEDAVASALRGER